MTFMSSFYVCARYSICSCDIFNQHRDSWLESGKCNTVVWKIEINLHRKAETGYYVLAAVKVMPDFDRSNPMGDYHFSFVETILNFE